MANLSFSKQGSVKNKILDKAVRYGTSRILPNAQVVSALGVLGGKSEKPERTEKSSMSEDIKPAPTTKSVPSTKATTKGLLSTPKQANQVQVSPKQGTPLYYAQRQESVAQITPEERSLMDEQAKLRGVYSGRVAAPFGSFGVGEGQNRLSDYELARYNAQLKGIEQQQAGLQTALQRSSTAGEGLLSASLPQPVSPGSSIITPVTGESLQGYSPTESAFRGGQISAIQGQGQRSVQLGQAQNIISGIKQTLGEDNATALTNLNAIVNDVRKRVSSPAVSAFRTQLGNLAAQLSEVNPELAKSLTDFSGEGLGNASPQAILAAIDEAQRSLQIQQQVAGQVTQQSQAPSGFIQTAVGQVPTNF